MAIIIMLKKRNKKESIDHCQSLLPSSWEVEHASVRERKWPDRVYRMRWK
jgi:hypothetical protein